MASSISPSPIGTLNEGPLHAALKEWYAQPGDAVEVPLGGRHIDLVRDDLLIEIQTASLGALKGKLQRLVDDYRIHIVHPIPHEKWLVKLDDNGDVISRRKSPRRGRVLDAFEEIVGLSKYLSHPNLSLEILLTQEEEVRRYEPGRVWRRKGWVIVERRLLAVLSRHRFQTPADFLAVLPAPLPAQFTTADIAEHLEASRDLAQKIAYCLRHVAAVTEVGKRGNAKLYSRNAVSS